MKYAHLKEFITNLPQQPGVYRYYNSEGTILYVGKAKKLKNRVSSYFQDSKNLNSKTRTLVAQIHRIEYTIVDTEFDAFLLENSLIKEYAPKYNIQLRDDKTYPYICITKEPFPKVFSTRNIAKHKGDFFGPYSNVKALNSLLEVLHKVYTIRTCQLSLDEKNVLSGKYAVCLDYHLGNCLGPCDNKQNYIDYNEKINQVKNVLKGSNKETENYFKEKINAFASTLEFEKAHYYKEKLDLLEGFQRKSIISSTRDINLVCVVLIKEESSAYIHVLELRNGTIVLSKNIRVKSTFNETEKDIITHVIINEIDTSKNLDIISNIELDIEFPFKYNVPKQGDKKLIIDIALKNALQFKFEKTQKKNTEEKYSRTKELQKLLHLTEDPLHIECFDNSNIQGSNPVASMVCFKNGKPSKKDYRHFNIKTVEGPNDFDSMTEIVKRRYKRLLEENEQLPNLVLIDGGKGQLSAAAKALKELGLYNQIPLIGIAKRLEEIYTPEDSQPLYFDKKSGALVLLQQLRNEAHRFAITFHRQKRSNNAIQSELENIKGIGENTIQLLLKKYKSTESVFSQSLEKISELIGKSKAQKIEDYKNKKGNH